MPIVKNLEEARRLAQQLAAARWWFDVDDDYYYIRWRLKLKGETGETRYESAQKWPYVMMS